MSNIKALLIGLNYDGSDHQLNGCINDVKLTKELLIKTLGVSSRNIECMTDHTNLKPTRINILKNLNEIIMEVNKNSSINTLWIHYSGHGTRVWDKNGDENAENDGLNSGADEAGISCSSFA